MKVEPFLIVSTVNVIIGQRLVRKLSGEKEKYFLSKAELATLGRSIDLDRMLGFLKTERVVGADDTWEKVQFWKPRTTTEHPEGFSGRIGIHEILKVSPSIKEIIMSGGTADVIEKRAKEEGMMTMIEDGIFKAVQGVTTLEEVLRVVSE